MFSTKTTIQEKPLAVLLPKKYLLHLDKGLGWALGLECVVLKEPASLSEIIVMQPNATHSTEVFIDYTKINTNNTSHCTKTQHPYCTLMCRIVMKFGTHISPVIDRSFIYLKWFLKYSVLKNSHHPG